MSSNPSFKNYPYYSDYTQPGTANQLRQICNLRNDDITTIKNLPQIFVGGRKVGKIPTDSDDVNSTDKIGDQNYDYNSGTPYFYILMDDGANGKWIRFSGSAF